MSLLALALKAISTAVIVVAASLVAERTRPFFAAMVLSLPVSAGPAYVILAFDHSPAFIAEAVLWSIATNVSIVPATVAYAAAARAGWGLASSYAAMIAAWLVTAAIVRQFDWTLASALVLNAIPFAIAIVATWRWRRAAAAAPPVRRWYDIPLRVSIVVGVVVSVVLVSERIGPTATGVAALFPASFTSFILLMHRRLGGPVVAAALINGLVMLIGFVGFLVAIYLFARVGRVWTGLAVGFVVPLVWSLAVFAFNRQKRA